MAATAEPKGLAKATGLSHLSKAQERIIAECDRAIACVSNSESFDELKGYEALAETLKTLAKETGKSVKIQNRAAELLILSRRRRGQLLTAFLNHKGGRPAKNTGASPGFSLKDIGVSEDDSRRDQKIASISDEALDSFFSTTKDAGKELTTAAVLRLAKGEAPEPEPWTIGDVLRALTTAARRIFDKCPEQDRETMAHKLRGLGDEILENGDLGA